MADSLNPFFEEEDFIEKEHIKETDDDNVTISDSGHDDVPIEKDSLNWDAVAAKLLKDKLILSALELHSELVESGRELPRLRDFFSNPANFERTKLVADTSPPGLPRTSSIQTFDSLDFARYSDDGDRQESEKVAVLEFELRKAHDTIKSLRASLTKSAETEIPTPDSEHGQVDEVTSADHIKPHECRALNFLVNEYLLMNDYKLTSVTFAEENENQDFEDWDDVGLNIAKPPDILHLYRDFGQHVTPQGQEMLDAECMVNMEDEGLSKQLEDLERMKKELSERVGILEDEITAISNENAFLTNQLKQYERISDKLNTARSSTPLISPITTPSKTKTVTVVETKPVINIIEAETKEGTKTNNSSIGVKPLEENDNDESSLLESDDLKHSDKHSVDKNVEEDTTTENNNDSVQKEQITTNEIDSMQVEVGSEMTGTLREDPIGGEEMSSHSHGELWQGSSRQMSEAFQKALLDIAFHCSQDNRIVSEVLQINQCSTYNVVLMLGRCLPHIVPNVILAKREELIPLIVTTATLHPDAKERDNLLNILFNLIKRPDVEQRQMILTGCVAFAQHVGSERVESELLPQCWEQINHKYAERRLLVAEACGALAPYLPSAIRSSLVLSMLQQMLEEDKVDDVREAVVRSLGILFGFIDTVDKYIQGGQMLMKTLIDSTERVPVVAMKVFLPAFGMWTTELGKLEKDLIPSLLGKLKNLVMTSSQNSATPSLDERRFTIYVQCLEELIPFLFAMVVQSGPFAQKIVANLHIQSALVSSRFPQPSCTLNDLSVIVGSSQHLASITHAYENYIGEEWYEPWEDYTWIAGDFIPELINFMNTLDASRKSIVDSLTKFFYNLCRTFGRIFTTTKVKQKFQVVLSIPEDHIDQNVTSGQTALTKCTAPVYVAGILAAFGQEEDHKALSMFLQDLMHTLALCQAPLSSIKASFTQLCENSEHHDVLLSVLWDGVVHTSALIRHAAAHLFEVVSRGLNEQYVGTRVIPALVTLASDPEISVRVATIPALGTIIETFTERNILDKVYMQLQAFVDDPAYKDQHSLHIELVRTFARVGPNAEPKFRDDFVLPRLAVLASNNNQQSNETQRREVAIQLFEAYSALSCCFISDQLIGEMMLPGLRCLHADVTEVAQDHVHVLESMIREFEEKVDSGKINESFVSNNSAAASTITGTPNTGEVMKNKMLSRFKDVTARFGSKK